MKPLAWNSDKNEKLKRERKVSFDQIEDLIVNEKIIGIEEHPNQKKYPDQQVLIVEIEGYVYLVPFIEDETKIYLKTIFPSRKATQKYLKSQGEAHGI